MKRNKEIKIRLCNWNNHDSNLLRKIHNHAVEAGYFNSKNKVSREEHKLWFESRMNNQNTTIFIGDINNTSFGYVRFDLVANNIYEVSLANLPSRVGKGLGSFMLNRAINEFVKLKKPNMITAVVKKFNERSISCFLKNKFEIINFNNKKHLTINKFSKNKDYYFELKNA